ncbi:hypothetical protein J3B01_004821 [Coemansia erecta]|nr:hypothetical protein J3B01_004821 [Coemansia erecta]
MSTRQQFVAKNGRAQVSVEGQIPVSLQRLLFGNDDSDDGKQLDADRLAERYLACMKKAICAMSIGGRYLALAYESRFMLLEWSQAEGRGECQLVSLGNDAAMADETITALYCIDIYTPQPQRRGAGTVCVVAGYSSGHMRVFSAYGHLLTAHQFHPQPLIRIRLRTPLPDMSRQRTTAVESEEMNLTFQDGTMVSVDGRSLYLALRLCLSEAADDSAGPMFQYKKWAFDLHTPRVSDAASFGPAMRDPLAQLAKHEHTSSPHVAEATARFLVAPCHGEAAFGVFATSEDAAAAVSAVAVAGKMAARVTGAVLSMAKSYFRRSTTLSESGQSTPSRTDAGTRVPCVLAVRDSPRKVLSIALSPEPYALAALTDSLGRVMVVDLESCEVVDMLKGLRGSQCAWMESTESDKVQCVYVVVYAARRGVVEVYAVGAERQLQASVSVGQGWTLVQGPTQPLGGSLVVETAGSERRATQPVPATCVLLGDNGRIARISA